MWKNSRGEYTPSVDKSIGGCKEVKEKESWSDGKERK